MQVGQATCNTANNKTTSPGVFVLDRIIYLFSLILNKLTFAGITNSSIVCIYIYIYVYIYIYIHESYVMFDYMDHFLKHNFTHVGNVTTGQSSKQSNWLILSRLPRRSFLEPSKPCPDSLRAGTLQNLTPARAKEPAATVQTYPPKPTPPPQQNLPVEPTPATRVRAQRTSSELKTLLAYAVREKLPFGHRARLHQNF